MDSARHKLSMMPMGKLIVIGIWVILMAAGSFFAATYLTNKHRESITEISQDRVLDVSEVVKKYGTPQLSDEAKRSGKSLTILFYYDGYEDETRALRHVGLMQGALKNTQPFASSDVIATRVITSGDDRCRVERKAQNILVCDKGLIDEINKLSIERFKLVVISPLEFVPNAEVTRGKNSAIYLPAHKGALTEEELNIFLTRFFLHELGHAFGLRDEYTFERTANQSTETHSDNIAYQAARPNCAPDMDTAKEWWGGYIASDKKVGYNVGCAGDNDYYFPQKETLMSANPQDADYGIVSEDYLRGVLDCFYGGKDAIAYLSSATDYADRITQCDTFRAQYPNFWTE